MRVECDYLSGVVAARGGEFANAMTHFRAGLARCDAVGASADPVRFNLWLNVALIHKEQGDAHPAGDALKKAAAVLAKFTEPDDLSAALIDAVRADLFLSQGQIAPALDLVPNLEAACTKHGRHGGYLWATARHVRALDLLSRKEIASAEALWTELADVQRREGHVLLARTLNFLGVCAELGGQNSEALKRFETARAFQAEKPRCPPTTRAITLWRLAVLTDKAGDRAAAKRLLTEVFDVADRARLNSFGEAAQRAQLFAQFAPAFELLAAWHARDGEGEGVLRTVARSRSRTLLDQMLAAGVDPRDRLTGDARATLLAREASARGAVSRLRSQAMQLTAEQADQPAAKKLLAELEAAQTDYTDVWREITNADPLTRVLTDPKFAEDALVQVRKAAHASGGVVLTYMIGRDASYAVLSTDPAAAPLVFKLIVPRAVSADIGDAPAGELVARAGFRGVVVKSTAKQPDRPPTPVSTDAVPLTDVVVARLVNHYLQQIADPSFNPTRGIALVSRKPGAAAKPTGAEVLGDAILPPALREKLRASGAKRLVLIPDGALHKLPFEALVLSAEPAPKYALDELPPVCYAPSLAVLAVVLTRPRANDGEPSLLTVGDPTYPAAAAGGALPQLPYTATESKTVRRFFPAARVTALEKTDATEAKVVAAMPGKRFVHLAAHGFADEAFGNVFGIGRAHPGAPRRVGRRRLPDTPRNLAPAADRVRADGVERVCHERRPAAPARSRGDARGRVPRCRIARGDGELLVGGRPRDRRDDGRVLRRGPPGEGEGRSVPGGASEGAPCGARQAGVGGAVLLGAVRVPRSPGLVAVVPRFLKPSGASGEVDGPVFQQILLPGQRSFRARRRGTVRRGDRRPANRSPLPLAVEGRDRADRLPADGGGVPHRVVRRVAVGWVDRDRAHLRAG